MLLQTSKHLKGKFGNIKKSKKKEKKKEILENFVFWFKRGLVQNLLEHI